MADIHPFAAYRYDLSQVAADDVLTQPYDKITPEMRRRYLERDAHNLVRVILGESLSSDNEGNNVYTRAEGCLRQWIEDGVLRRDPEPAIYPYEQTFQAPGATATQTRRGFIALGRLEDYDRNVVFRHEQTLTGPKQDRLRLLRATRTHLGQIFMLYSDPSGRTEEEIFARAESPVLTARDEYRTEHRLFRETDGGVITRLRQSLSRLPLVIADGHHRYETALAWRDEERQRLPHYGPSPAPWDFAMMTFVNLDAPGLVVLPTHRVVDGLADWNPAQFLARAAEFFTVEPRPVAAAGWTAAWPALEAELARAEAAAQPAFAAVLAGQPGAYLFRLRPGLDLAAALPGYNDEQRRLAVLLLHELALERGLGITPEAVRGEKHVRFERDAHAAVRAVWEGSRDGGLAQAAFLLAPVAPQTVRDVALSGAVMPQKSTDFFPKLLSGLTLYRME
ncbi:MAG: DUF1015 domain-containing protein [Terriglobales bacterium]